MAHTRRHSRPSVFRTGPVPLAGAILAVLLILCLAAVDVPLHARDSDGDGSGDTEGRWRMARPEHRDRLTEEQREEVERLRSIGYLSGSRQAPEVSGVTVHDGAKALDGLNFVLSGHRPGAALMDMSGRVLHEWSVELLDVWPDKVDEADDENAQYWRAAHLFENGDVIAIFEGIGIIKVDADSRIIWAHDNGAHHDLQVLDDGRICTLTRDAHIVRRINPATPILEDFVEILDADGNSLRRVSTLEAFENSMYSNVTELLGMRRIGDIFHTNSVQYLDGSMVGRIPAFAEGNVLISTRKQSLVAVVDMNREEVVWAFTGLWNAQHMPRQLRSGHILVFDNLGNQGRSRVIEFDPMTQEIIWVYAGDRPEDFYTQMCGANHRLPNGNTLIIESDYGRAFEVTETGEIIWEYVNPERAGRTDELIATLFDVQRLSTDFPTTWATGR